MNSVFLQKEVHGREVRWLQYARWWTPSHVNLLPTPCATPFLGIGLRLANPVMLARSLAMPQRAPWHVFFYS